MLHNAVVDADAGQGRVDGGEAGGLVALAGGLVELSQAPGQVGQELFDGAHHVAGAEDEDAAVPEVVAAFDEGARLLERRLLDEALDAEGVAAERVAGLDVAEAGLGAGGGDAHGGQEARLGLGERLAESRAEGVFVADDMVGWEDHHEGVGVAPRDDVGRPADAGRGVAADGLAKNLLRGQIG